MRSNTKFSRGLLLSETLTGDSVLFNTVISNLILIPYLNSRPYCHNTKSLSRIFPISQPFFYMAFACFVNVYMLSVHTSST